MKYAIAVFLVCLTGVNAFADLKYYPIQFKISTDKEGYYEGEKVTFHITITNTDKENTYPVLLPHTQNVGQKLFCLNLYDKANNTMLLRATEDPVLKMMVHDTGTVKIRYLAPQEAVVLDICLNDFENYYSYHTQNSSHHSFGVPVFAGKYKVNLTYNPFGIPLGDSIYSYYHDFFHDSISSSKLAMDELGQPSNLVELKIKRSADTVVSIEGNSYYIKYDGHRYWYFSEDVKEIINDLRLVHLTNIPVDSFSVAGEYYYTHHTGIYAEYITRFEDDDIKEYRKFRDVCPDYLYTEKYNDFKQKVLFACQLPDKRFYKITYGQPTNKIYQESYCSNDGSLCIVTTYFYNKKAELIKKKVTQTQPCLDVELQ